MRKQAALRKLKAYQLAPTFGGLENGFPQQGCQLWVEGSQPYLRGKDGSLHHGEVLLVQHLVHVWEAPPTR